MAQPIDIMLVIDHSSSMDAQKLAAAKNAAKILLGRMNLSQDQVGLVTFAASADLNHALSQDGNTVAAAIDAITGSHRTNIAAGINAAAAELASNRHNPNASPVMILLSDGRANEGEDPQKAADAAKAQGIRLIVIGFGDNADQKKLRTMASSSSDYYFAPASSDLEAIYATVAGTVHCR